jgi:hypothetical protein
MLTTRQRIPRLVLQVRVDAESDPAIPFQRYVGTARFAHCAFAFMAVARKLNVAHVAAFDAFVGVEHQIIIHVVFHSTRKDLRG